MRLIIRNPATMTNRELQNEFDRIGDRNQNDRLQIITEMAKRINALERLSADPSEETITEVNRDFQHWKLNGAGSEKH
jgi:hypothetical protein